MIMAILKNQVRKSEVVYSCDKLFDQINLGAPFSVGFDARVILICILGVFNVLEFQNSSLFNNHL